MKILLQNQNHTCVYLTLENILLPVSNTLNSQNRTAIFWVIMQQLVNFLLTFRDNLLVPSSQFKHPKKACCSNMVFI